MLEVSRGDDRVIVATVNNANGDPFVWSGAAKVWFTAKVELSDSDDDAILFKTSSAGQIDLSTDGTALIILSHEDWETLVNIQIDLWVDLQMKTVDGKIYTVINDTLRVLAEVTLATS